MVVFFIIFMISFDVVKNKQIARVIIQKIILDLFNLKLSLKITLFESNFLERNLIDSNFSLIN